MSKLKILAYLVTIALVISVGVNAFVVNQNFTLSNQNKAKGAQLEMSTILAQVQVQVDAELRKLGGSLAYASEQLSAIGLEGDQARVVLSALAANSSFTIEAATQNLNRTMMTVEPAAYHSSEGKILGPQKWLNTNPLGPIQPCMTDVLPLIVGFRGVSIVAPVFDLNTTLIGTISIAFDHVALIKASVTQAVAGTPYTMWATQTIDGLVIYDADPDQIGLMLFSDPAYEQYPQMLTVMHQIVDMPSGHSTYQYLRTLASAQLVTKECYWSTVSEYGGEWRLVIVHVLDA